MKPKKPHLRRSRRTCYHKMRMRALQRRATPAASAWLQLLAIFLVIFGRMPLPFSASATSYVAPPLKPKQVQRSDIARRLGIPARYVDVILACGRVPYPILFEDIRKGGPMRTDAIRELRKQIPDAAIEWFDHVKKEGLWCDLMRCFDRAGPDEDTDIRFLQATLRWLGGPNGDVPDPNGHGFPV